MNRSPHPSIAALMVVGSCVSLQFGAAIAAPLFGVFGPALTTTGRLLIAGAVLIALFRPRFWTWTGRQWRAVVLFGLAMGAMNGCFYAAIDRIPLGIAVTIEFIGPLALAAVLSRRLRDGGWVVLAGAAIVVLGLDGTGDGRPLDPIGVLFALAAGACWAGYILTGTRVGALVPGHGALAMSVVVGAAIVAPFGVGSAGAIVSAPVYLLPLAAVAILSSVIPYTLEFASMRGLDPRAFGVLLSLEPVVATLAGWMLLGQAVTWLHIAAMAAVVVASTGSTLSAARRPVAPRADAAAPATAPTPVAG